MSALSEFAARMRARRGEVVRPSITAPTQIRRTLQDLEPLRALGPRPLYSTRSSYVCPFGNPLTPEEWAERFGRPVETRRIALDISPAMDRVSTIWIGNRETPFETQVSFRRNGVQGEEYSRAVSFEDAVEMHCKALPRIGYVGLPWL